MSWQKAVASIRVLNTGNMLGTEESGELTSGKVVSEKNYDTP